MSDIGKIIRTNALPSSDQRENNVIYQVAAPGAATYKDYAIDSNGDLKTPSYIPLTGTEEGKPLTKNIEVDPSEEGSVGLISNTSDVSEAVLVIQENDSILAESSNSSENSSSSIHIHYDDGIEISATTSDEQFSAIIDTSGLKGDNYILPTSDEHYVQKKFVADNFTSQNNFNNTLANYYTKPETYSKAEVDAKLSAVYRPKGSVANFASLPSSGNTEGDVWNVLDTGANYVWVTNLNNTGVAGWDKLSETIDLTNYVTINTEQTVEARKTFAGAIDNSYAGAAIMVNGNGPSNTVFPTIAFHQPTLYAATLSFRGGSGFHFTNIDGSGYESVYAAGFVKINSDDSHVLLGGGGHKLLSDFALASDLSGYVTTYSEQAINAQKTFVTGYSSYTEDGLFSSDAKPLRTSTPSSQGVLFGYRDYGGGQYYARIGFKNDASLSNWSFGLNGNDVTLGTNNSATTDTFTFSSTGVLSIKGDEANNTASFNSTSGVGNIASGWLHSFYGNIWKYGMSRGGSSGADGVKFGFDFSSDGGATYNRMLSIDANNERLELKRGGRINPWGSITVQQESSGPNATGLFWESIDDSQRISGIGTYTVDGDYQFSYIGWSDSPWLTANSLVVASDIFTYKDYKVFYQGDIINYPNSIITDIIKVGGTDYLQRNLLRRGWSPTYNFYTELNVPSDINNTASFILSQNGNGYINGSNIWHSGNLNPNTLVQVGGINNQGNLIYLAWTGSNLQLTVDNTTIGNIWHSENFDPSSKANALQNGTGIGFTSGDYPTNDGISYPYMYHGNSGNNTPFVPLATQGWVNYRFNNLTGDFVTIDGTPQNILGDKNFASTSTVTFEGADLNNINVFRQTNGDVGIVSGHEYTHYDTRWKVGNRRGGSTNSLGFSFEFSNDGGTTYTEKARIDEAGFFTGNAFASPILTGAQVFNANNTNQLFFGNGVIPTVFYQTLGSHVFQVDGNIIATVNSGGLAVTGTLSLNGSDIITEVQKGTANGVAPLGVDAKIPSAYLPSYVDDVLEFVNLVSFPTTGEAGKIYVALDTNLTYRWGGSSYTQIASGAVQSVNGQTGIVNLSKSDIGLSNIDNTADATKNVLSATKWTTPRTLSYTGDVTGSASVDGSGNVNFAMSLANSGVSAGTYNSVNVDAKGRVLSGNHINYATESYVADFLQQNYFDKTVTDERFVNTEGDETINGNKTFSSSPSIPPATNGEHAVNLEQLTASLSNVVYDNDDFEILEVYRLIDSNHFDLDDTRVKKYNIVFDGASNGSVNITHLRDNQYYQFSNVSGSGADLRVGVEGYGMVDIVSSGKTAVYMSWGDGKLLKISENTNFSII